MSEKKTMKDWRAEALRDLRAYAAKSCDPELIRISNRIQYIFGDTPLRVVTYLERSPRSKESSAIVYSEEKGNPDSGQYHLRFGGYESTEITDFYRPVSPHDVPPDMTLYNLIEGE